MRTGTTVQNWAMGNTPNILQNVHQREVNIAIFNRDIVAFQGELDRLMDKDIELRASGPMEDVSSAITQAEALHDYPLIQEDLKALLQLFGAVTGASSFRLLLATVNSNMCSKFHTDINDLRMLCTYRGPGTLWLTEDNINRDALDCCDEEDCLIIDEGRIQQAATGAVVILKGAIYPKEDTTPVLHRSPTIEESKESRLLLRLDTNGFFDF
ncbi:MAG: DUF1826 domain-containing protein [Bacteroidota bacterium]